MRDSKLHKFLQKAFKENSVVVQKIDDTAFWAGNGYAIYRVSKHTPKSYGLVVSQYESDTTRQCAEFEKQAKKNKQSKLNVSNFLITRDRDYKFRVCYTEEGEIYYFQERFLEIVEDYQLYVAEISNIVGAIALDHTDNVIAIIAPVRVTFLDNEKKVIQLLAEQL